MSPNSKSSAAVISEGKVVQLAYILKSDEGEVLDEADAQDPFVYLHGADQIVPGLESALEGCKVGDKKTVKVEAADGYGEEDPALVLTVKRTQFPKDVELEEGMQFESELADGSEVVFTVEAIEGDSVSVNGNHPLAGVNLNFDVEVLAIREATSDEIEHGHAHGEHGHHH
jgi:FKBP-type peptidyl-prolyl cis-trans isomerase SlyD